MAEQKEQENVDFTIVEITEKQFVTRKKDSTEPLYVSENGTIFGKIICPDGGSIWYPTEHMRVYENKTRKTYDGEEVKLLYFIQPTGTQMEIHYSNGKDVEDTIKVVTIEDLKQIFAQARVDYARENSTFVNMQVPTSWDRTPKDEEYARISIPIDTNGEKQYYTFIVKRDNFRPSNYRDDYSYFGFPRKITDKETGEVRDYTITLRGEVKDENGQYVKLDDGTYAHTEITVSSADLKSYVDEAVSASIDRHKDDSHSLLDDLGFDIPKKAENEVNSKEQTAQATEAAAPAPQENEEAVNRFHRTR